jgi:hypothetical protein
MMNSIAILNSLGRVITFVQADVPDGWTPPDGCTAVPDDQLPDGWQMEPERHYMADVRRERNERLNASDWTQVADAPVDQTAWATYRQALRDLPSVYTGDGPIPWPQEPA